MSTATYRTLLRTSGAAGFFRTAAGGRIGIAMTSLGMVWLVHATTGSYAIAGLATGALALAEASIGPQLGRLFDRCGQTWLLAVVAGAHLAAALSLVLLAQRDVSVWLLALGGFGVGATMPQLGALSAT